MKQDVENNAAMTSQAASEFECRFESVIPLARLDAFKLVVDHPELWWCPPLSEAPSGGLDVRIEPFAGGACYQIDDKGQRCIWGTVLSIEEPLYIRISWQVAQDGSLIADPAAASRVMLNFREAGEVTRVEVVHNKFLRHGESGGEYMQLMMQSSGWPRILKNLVEAAKTLKRK
ncbi:SRPBCC family protein [Roseibium alexandrii]|uniref:SRPBCC family protein n=1 Tax=Roseibium alexandrii TaxID=388408 RepID=UPI0037504BD6